jgi:serine/threonine protein phosphatase PrpC
MEDKHVIIPHFNEQFGLENYEKQSYFAIFDGHAGVEAANFAKIHLHFNLIHHKLFKDDVASALVEAFAQTDKMFLENSAIEVNMLFLIVFTFKLFIIIVILTKIY